MTTRRASFRSTTIYPAVNTLIAGCIAAALADSIGWPASTCGLMIALILWTVQLIAALPTPTPARAMLPVEQTVRLRVLQDDGQAGEYLQFGIDAVRLREFAVGVTAGKPLSLRTWSPGLFTQGEYSRFVAELVRVGLARQLTSDARGGVALSAKGKAVMRGLAQ